MMFRTFLVMLLGAFALSPLKGALINFTFTEAVSGGTITGQIIGLNSVGTSTPTEIVISSQPAGYPNAAPINLLASGYTFYNTDNNFTVSGGAITGADVLIYKTVTGGNYQGYVFDFTSATFGVANENGVFLANSSLTILQRNDNTGGFSGVTYAPVPEPRETALLFLLAALGLLAVRKLRSRTLEQPRAVTIG